MLTAMLSPLSHRLEKMGGHRCRCSALLRSHIQATSTKHKPPHLSEPAGRVPARAAAEKKDIDCNQALNISQEEARGAMGLPTCRALRVGKVLPWQTQASVPWGQERHPAALEVHGVGK